MGEQMFALYAVTDNKQMRLGSEEGLVPLGFAEEPFVKELIDRLFDLDDERINRAHHVWVHPIPYEGLQQFDMLSSEGYEISLGNPPLD